METQPTYKEPTSVSDPVALRAVYLKRLQRLVRLRRQHEEELNRQGLRLLEKSVFAAYCACREVGAEQEAMNILQAAGLTKPDGVPRRRAS
jgi:hypothetical protein